MYIRFDNRTVFLPGPRILKRVTQGHHSHNPHSSTVTLQPVETKAVELRLK